MDPAADDASSKITRVRFTKEQLTVLEDFFTKTTESPSPSQLEDLSKRVDTTLARVKNWFNTRRAKKRKSIGGEAAGDDEAPESQTATPVVVLPPPASSSSSSSLPTPSSSSSSSMIPAPASSSLKRKADDPAPLGGGAPKAQKTEKGKAKLKGKGKAPEEEEEEEEEEEGNLSDMELIAPPLGIDWGKVTDVSRLQGEILRLSSRLKETEGELKTAKARIKELEKGGAPPAAPSTSAAAHPLAVTSALLASARKKGAVTVVGEADPTPAEIKQAEQVAGKLKKSIPSQLLNQMVYRSGLLYSKSRLSAEVPNVSVLIFKALVGEDHFKEFANKKLTQYKLSLTSTTYGQIFSKDLYKSLRYGAHLEPNWPLSLTFNKGTQMLTLKGTYTMVK